MLPILLNNLGKDAYGLVVFAQTVCGYFVIFINFGFNISATKDISQNRNDPKKITEIVSSVLQIKTLLLLFSFFILFVLCEFFPILQENNLLFYFSLSVCIGNIFFPIWYYQGVEKMRYITMFVTMSKILSAFLIFIFIQDKEDYILVPIFYSLGSLVGAIIAMYILLVNEKVRIEFQKLRVLKIHFKKSISFFISDFSGVLKDNANILIIGSFIGMSSVALYDLAAKIVWAFRSLFANANSAFFPMISKSKNPKDSKFIIILFAMLSLLAYIFLYYFSDFIIKILSNESMLVIKDILWIMAFFIITATLSSSIGLFVLVTNEKTKEYLNSMLYAILTYVLMVAILFVADSISLFNLAIVYNLSVLFELCLRVYYCKKYNLIKWLI